MLPVLFVLMLPARIFGGLTSSGSAGQLILNDNAAIVQNTNNIAFAVNQVLGGGITDAETWIAQDFATTGGDNYEVVNPLRLRHEQQHQLLYRPIPRRQGRDLGHHLPSGYAGRSPAGQEQSLLLHPHQRDSDS